jgi:hypothetical protein
MRKLILLSFVVFIFCNYLDAQCDKKVVWTSAKEEFLDANGAVEQAQEDSVIIETSKTGITINHNNIPEDELKGTVTNVQCDWKEPYKNGKTIIKTNLTEASGETNEDSTLTIEGKDGQITILLQMKGRQLKVFVAKYEEKS